MDDKLQRELIQKAHEGDSKAREQLIMRNYNIVHNIANKMVRRNPLLDYETIRQIGSIGLIRAADTYDFNKGAKFSTYAYIIIEGKIRQFTRDYKTHLPYRVNRKDYNLYAKIYRIIDELTNELSHEPNHEEIAKKIGVTTKEVEKTMMVFEQGRSLDVAVSSEKNKKSRLIAETIKDETIISEEQILNKLVVNEAISTLTEKEQKIIHLRYFEDLTQQQTAVALGMTQVTISRKEKAILEKLKYKIKITPSRGNTTYGKGKTIGSSNGKKVICITTGVIFTSIKEAGKFSNTTYSHITECCKGERKSAGKLADGTKLQWRYY